MKIIAELCQNHNGNVDVMHQMIDAAADAGQEPTGGEAGDLATAVAEAEGFREARQLAGSAARWLGVAAIIVAAAAAGRSDVVAGILGGIA